jgi:hypothetical protein
MKELFFDKPMVEEAKRWAEDLGGINNSILKGGGNLAGRLGEIALARHLDVDIEDHKDYDMIYKGDKIEVKTKRRTVPPQYSYDVSVAETSTHQKPDIYAFVSIEFEESGFWGSRAVQMSNNRHSIDWKGKDYVQYKRKGGKWYKKPKSIWLCGYYSANKYFEDAEKKNHGDVDKSNNFMTWADMYNMRIGDLDNGL